MGDVAEGELGGFEGGLGGGETGLGVGVVHLEEELAGLYLVADADVDLLDDSGGLGVGLEVVDGLYVAVGGGQLDEVLIADFGGADVDTLAGQVMDGDHHQDEGDEA